MLLLLNIIPLSQANNLYFNKTIYGAQAGENFNVTLYARTDDLVYGIFLYEMYWDSSIVKGISYEDLSKWDVSFTYGGGLYDDRFCLTNWWKMGKKDSGVIPLINITFQAIKKGQTDIQFKIHKNYCAYGSTYSGERLILGCNTSKIIINGNSSSNGNSYIPSENQLPIPKIIAPNNVTSNTTIFFDGRQSYDPDGNITSYHWDLGDYQINVGSTTNYTYSRPGEYMVSLTVIDSNNTNNETFHNITVKQEITKKESKPKDESLDIKLVFAILFSIVMIVGCILFMYFRRK